MNQKQLDALYIIENFILYYTSNELDRDRMVQAAMDYVEQDHVINELEEA